MLREGTFVRVVIPETSIAVFCWDWTTIVIAGVALLAALLSFLCSAPDPGEDSLVLLQLAMAIGIATAGNPLMMWPLLCLSAGGLALFVATSQELRPVLALVGGGVSVAAAAVGAGGLAVAFHLSRHEPLSLLDLCFFPADSLASMGLLGLGLMGGLAAVAGGFPFTLKHPAEWRAMGTRRAAASLGLGPGSLALFVWLKVAVYGRPSLQACLALPILRSVLYGTGALGVVYHLVRLIKRRRPDDIREVLWGLQCCYGLLAMVSGTADAMGLYAFVLWAIGIPLSFAGLALADRISGEASVSLRVVSWASLLGAPPLAGFWSRYVLLRTLARVGGHWWWVALLPWLIEAVAVLSALRHPVSRPRPAETLTLEPCGLRVAWAGTVSFLILQVAAGPVGLVVSDAIALQVVTGGTSFR